MTVPRSAPIEVRSIKRLDNGGNLKAFASVRIGAVVIHSYRVVQQPGQKAWCSPPQTKSGERWYPLVEITSDDLTRRVSAAVLEAWQGQRQEAIPPSRARSRQDPRQAAVDEWAARFDERGPDREPGF